MNTRKQTVQAGPCSARFSTAPTSRVSPPTQRGHSNLQCWRRAYAGLTADEVMNKLRPPTFRSTGGDRARPGAEHRTRNHDHAGFRGPGLQGLARIEDIYELTYIARMGPGSRRWCSHGAARRAGRHIGYLLIGTITPRASCRGRAKKARSALARPAILHPLAHRIQH